MTGNSDLARVRYVKVSNNSGYTIPAYGMMQITGYTTIDGTIVYSVDVFSSTEQRNTKFLINGPTPIEDGGYGLATRDTPHLVKYANFDTPALGDRMNGLANDFMATKQAGGVLMACGAGSGSPNYVVPVVYAHNEPPFLAVSVDNTDGYRKNGGSVEKFTIGTFTEISLEINGTGVLDESAALGNSVEAYNVSRRLLHSGDIVRIYRDPRGQYCALPLDVNATSHGNVGQPCIVFSGAWTGHTTNTKTETNWSVASLLSATNYGELALVSGGAGTFEYTNYFDWEFYYKLKVTPGSAGVFNVQFSAPDGQGPFYTPPMDISTAKEVSGIMRGQVAWSEGDSLGSHTATLVGWNASTTWDWTYEYRLQPRTRGFALGIGY